MALKRVEGSLGFAPSKVREREEGLIDSVNQRVGPFKRLCIAQPSAVVTLMKSRQCKAGLAKRQRAIDNLCSANNNCKVTKQGTQDSSKVKRECADKTKLKPHSDVHPKRPKLRWTACWWSSTDGNDPRPCEFKLEIGVANAF